MEGVCVLKTTKSTRISCVLGDLYSNPQKQFSCAEFYVVIAITESRGAQTLLRKIYDGAPSGHVSSKCCLVTEPYSATHEACLHISVEK